MRASWWEVIAEGRIVLACKSMRDSNWGVKMKRGNHYTTGQDWVRKPQRLLVTNLNMKEGKKMKETNKGILYLYNGMAWLLGCGTVQYSNRALTKAH
jgi:hypothetical protein